MAPPLALHLVKLCVGVSSPAQLAQWQAQYLINAARRGNPARLSHVTRSFPRRAQELLAGGSLYWVFNGFIQARQSVRALEKAVRNGAPACRIVFDPRLVLTRSMPRRPFQGWRYLAPQDAPPDLDPAEAGSLDGLPEDMRRDLAALGLI